MSRRVAGAVAAAALAGSGCAVFDDAVDRGISRAFGQSEADYRRSKEDRERVESLTRAGWSEGDAWRSVSHLRETEAGLRQGSKSSRVP